MTRQGLSYDTAGTEVGRPSWGVYPLIREKDSRYTEKQNQDFEGNKIGDGAAGTRGGQLQPGWQGGPLCRGHELSSGGQKEPAQ